MGKKLASIIISAVIAATLTPIAAFGSDLTVGTTGLDQEAKAQASQVASQASKVKMKLLVKATTDSNTCTFAYKNGLMTKMTKKGSDNMTIAYSYSGKRMKSISAKTGTQNLKIGAFKYDGKSRLIKAGPSTNGTEYLYTYDSKNRVKKQMMRDRYGTDTYKYTYNAKNDPKKWDTGFGRSTFAYDDKGNLKTRKYLSKSYGRYNLVYTWKYSNTYKKGFLVKRVITRIGTSGSASETTRFTYKSISVPKAYASLIKKQQISLINDMNMGGCTAYPIRERISSLQ